MLHDQWNGKGLADAEFRKMFSRETLLASDWYAARLKAKQKVDRALWRRHTDYLAAFLRKPSHGDIAETMGIGDRLVSARKTLEEIESPAYLEKLRGTLGAEPVENYLAK